MTPAGRPEVGTPINIRLGDDLLARVDALAAYAKLSRAEVIRRLVTVGLHTARDYELNTALAQKPLSSSFKGGKTKKLAPEMMNAMMDAKVLAELQKNSIDTDDPPPGWPEKPRRGRGKDQ